MSRGCGAQIAPRPVVSADPKPGPSALRLCPPSEAAPLPSHAQQPLVLSLGANSSMGSILASGSHQDNPGNRRTGPEWAAEAQLPSFFLSGVPASASGVWEQGREGSPCWGAGAPGSRSSSLCPSRPRPAYSEVQVVGPGANGLVLSRAVAQLVLVDVVAPGGISILIEGHGVPRDACGGEVSTRLLSGGREDAGLRAETALGRSREGASWGSPRSETSEETPAPSLQGPHCAPT